MKTVSHILTDIKNKSNQLGTESYLYGESLREILSNKVPNKVTIFVKSKNDCDADFTQYQSEKIEIKFGKSLNSLKSCFTVNSGYWNLNDMFINNKDEILPVSSKKDIFKKTIKFTREAKDNVADNPEIIYEALLLPQTSGFYLDSQTVDFIFHNKRHLLKLSKRTIQNFLKDTVKTEKARKIISNLNALGISKELFGNNLVESSYLNHLKSKDFYEFLYLIFNDIPSETIDEFLVEKTGLPLRDVKIVQNLSLAIEQIEGETEYDARKFLRTLGNNLRFQSVCRLLSIMGFKTLSKNVRVQRNAPIFEDKICVNENIIKAAFGVEDSMLLEKLLTVATEKILQEPDFNKQHKILAYLNKERGLLWQEKREASN